MQTGVDLIDVTSGGTVPTAKIPVGKGYQVPFARGIREEAGIRTGAVGMITDAEYANEIITGGSAIVVLSGAYCCANRLGDSRPSAPLMTKPPGRRNMDMRTNAGPRSSKRFASKLPDCPS